MSLLCVCHDAPRNGTVISDQFNIPSGPVLGVHLSQRRRLLKGGAEEVRAAIDAVCGSRPGKALKREREYFKRNGGRGRMDYARIAALKLPIGSGAIESAIRRVVNLRLKGPSIYWHKTTAEAVLLLRSYYKAGRWNHLERQALTTTTGIAA